MVDILSGKFINGESQIQIQTHEKEYKVYELLKDFEIESKIFPKVYEASKIDENKYLITIENLVFGMQEPVYFQLTIGKWLHNILDASTNDLVPIPPTMLAIKEFNPDSSIYITADERISLMIPKKRKLKWIENHSFHKANLFTIKSFKYPDIQSFYNGEYFHLGPKNNLEGFLKNFFTNLIGSIKVIQKELDTMQRILIDSEFLNSKIPFNLSMIIAIDKTDSNNVKVKLHDFADTFSKEDVLKSVASDQKESILKAIKNFSFMLDNIKNSMKSTHKVAKPLTNINFDDVDREFAEIEKQEAENDVDIFFKQLYKNSSVETQMAMKKSFTESGGTVLSTNWDEVKNSKVEYKN